jgi:hypothetical protein
MRAFNAVAALAPAMLVGAGFGTTASAQYSPSLTTGYYRAGNPPVEKQTPGKYPPSWYYNPYTDHSGQCAQGSDGGGPHQCERNIQPSTPLR